MLIRHCSGSSPDKSTNSQVYQLVDYTLWEREVTSSSLVLATILEN